MRQWIGAVLFGWTLACGAAHAQQAMQYAGQGVPVTDPATYSQSIAHEISRDRMQPIRRAMRQMLGVTELSADLEVGITQMERFLGEANGTEIVKLEDVSLAGALRRIYYLNSFPGKFLFTRFDFTRGSDGWVLTGITFGNSWNNVNANPVTPGWTVTQ